MMRFKLLWMILLLSVGYITYAQNSEPVSAKAASGHSLNFDGKDDQIIVPNYPELRIHNGTLEAWIKIIDSTNFEWHSIISKELDYQLTLRDYRLATYDWKMRKVYCYGNSLNDNKWHHVAFTFRDSILNGSQLYLDGEPIGPPFTYHTLYDGSELNIGGNHFTDQYFNGNIDEVRIWKRVLTAVEIKQNCHTEIPSNSPGLILYYKFNKGIAGGDNEIIHIAKDETLNGLDGNLSKFTLQGASSNFIEETPVAPYAENEFIIFFKLNRWIIFWSVLTCCIGFIAYKIRIQYLESKNKLLEKIVLDRTKQLASMLDEKDVLIQEIHHRVKNNLQFMLSLIEMQIMVNKNNDNDALQDVSRRLTAMSLVHELLYRQNDIEQISTQHYFDGFIASMRKFIEQKSTVLNYKIDDIVFNVSQCIAVGMIMSELISNSIKYAFPNEPNPSMMVQIEQAKGSNEIVLQYRDNGIGFSSATNTKGLGSTLIDVFSRQLNGNYVYQNENGVIFTLKFSI